MLPHISLLVRQVPQLRALTRAGWPVAATSLSQPNQFCDQLSVGQPVAFILSKSHQNWSNIDDFTAKNVTA